MNVMAAPEVAPAAPKHAIVESVGHAPFVFAITSGDLPVALYIQPSKVYLALWYIEKETVRTIVILAKGDRTPVDEIVSKRT